MTKTLNSLTLQAYNLFHREQATEIEKFFVDLRWLLENVCESPIEQLFLIDLLRYSQFFKTWIRRGGPSDPSFLGFRMAGWGPATGNLRVMVFPQYRLILDSSVTLSRTKNYRVDLLIEVVEELSLEAEKPILSLVVELDGHDFHERTKEQAQRDKERDRNMTRAGYKIMRFTGSEIYMSVKSQLEETNEEIEVNPIAKQVMAMIEEEANARSKSRSPSRNK
jgi:hypothetical protein